MKKANKNYKLFFVIIIMVIVIFLIFKYARKNNSDNKSQNSAKNNATENGENYENNTSEYVKEIENGIMLNKSSKMGEDKKLGNLKISNTQLTTKNGMTTLLADVTNEGTSSTELKVITLKLLDESGNTLISLTGVIEALEPGKKTQLNISMTSDYIEAYDFAVFEK